MAGAHGLKVFSPVCCGGPGQTLAAAHAYAYHHVAVTHTLHTHTHSRGGGGQTITSTSIGGGRRLMPIDSIRRRIELDGGLSTTMSEDEDEDEDDCDEDSEMGEALFQAIEELEQMVREPAQVLEEMNHKLSLRELHLLLLYFSQQGRDSWCALEVFHWLHNHNRVHPHTTHLMLSIMSAWLSHLIQAQRAPPAHVVHLLVDMDCVGLTPTPTLIQKLISLYWEMGNKDHAVLFVKQLLSHQFASTFHHPNPTKGGPTGYLAWRFMADGDYMAAVKLVNDFRKCGLKPEAYSYLIAMTAVVKELNEFSKVLRKLRGFIKAGLVVDLDVESVMFIDKYQSDVISEGIRLSKWLFEEESSLHPVVVHERLLAMYICAGRGLEAEQQLWEMKRIGKEPNTEIYNIVLAICASQKESGAVSRLLTGLKISNSTSQKKTLLWLLRGYVKGGHFEDASRTIMKMLSMGLCPEYLDRAAVLHGLRNNIQESGNMDAYVKLCESLSEADLIGPCILYVHMERYQLWVIKMS